jgi:integrase
MTPEQVTQALAVLDLRERLFCRFAIFAGMRPGEIIALKWTDIDGGMARVDDRYYKGKQGTTKNRKPRMVALADSLQSDLALWHEFNKVGFVFPSETELTPIKYENLWQRDIRPRFEKIGLKWADFRAMRRTNSTLMRAAGADAKVSADNRGHGLGVAMEEYTHSTPEQKKQAVQKLESFVN